MNKRGTTGKVNPYSIGLLAAGAAVIGCAALAIGLSIARSSDPEQGKQEILDRMAATQSAAAEYAAEHPESVPTRSPGFVPTGTAQSWSVGIVDTGQAPFRGSQYLGENGWSWDLNGNHVGVFAGAEGPEEPDPGRGVIIKVVTSMDLQTIPTDGGWHLAPEGVGSLHIVSYAGTVLTVEATTGDVFYFDAETQGFTDSNGSPVPTDSPTPTYAPHDPGPTISPDPESDTPTPTAAPTFAPTAAPTAAAGN